MNLEELRGVMDLGMCGITDEFERGKRVVSGYLDDALVRVCKKLLKRAVTELLLVRGLQGLF